jgi:hypothetical protein
MVVLIGDDGAVFLCQLETHHCNREIGCERVTRGVGGVMRQSTQRKGVLIQVFGLFDERDDEIAASDIVRQIAEELAPKRVIAHVLDDSAAINIGVGLQKFFRSRVGKACQEKRHNVVPPCRVDDSFVRQNAVTRTARGKTCLKQ